MIDKSDPNFKFQVSSFKFQVSSFKFQVSRGGRGGRRESLALVSRFKLWCVYVYVLGWCFFFHACFVGVSLVFFVLLFAFFSVFLCGVLLHHFVDLYLHNFQK